MNKSKIAQLVTEIQNRLDLIKAELGTLEEGEMTYATKIDFILERTSDASVIGFITGVKEFYSKTGNLTPKQMISIDSTLERLRVT